MRVSLSLSAPYFGPVSMKDFNPGFYRVCIVSLRAVGQEQHASEVHSNH